MPPGFTHLVVFSAIGIAVFFLATRLYPRLMLSIYKRAILVQGVDSGPIPINTLYTQPQALFLHPFAPLPPGGSRLLSYGTNRDTLYVCGWLDLSKGPLILRVPDMAGRYYSVQFTDPSTNTNYAYVGKRTTGTAEGSHLVTGLGWKGATPAEMNRIASPNNSVLVIGRVFVEDESDLPTAWALAQQIRIDPAHSGSAPAAGASDTESSHRGGEMKVPTPQLPRTIDVTSPEFDEGRPIPARFTCRGSGVSPAFKWSGVPEEAVAVAVIVSDPDAPRGTFLHWLVTGLPGEDGGFDEGAAPRGRELINSANEAGWCPPCPPSGTHRYIFAVHALDQPVTASSSQPALDEIADHTIAWGSLTGLVAH